MKLILLCHGATAAMRVGGFPAEDDAIDEGALRKLAGARLTTGAVVCGPARAARETAAALGLDPAIVPALRDLDYAEWSGRSFAELRAEHPDALAAWLGAPWNGTPGGESFASAIARAAAWLRAAEAGRGPVLAIVSPMIVRAVLAAAIDLPAPTAMRIDVAPLTTAMLSRRQGWRLQQLGAPIGT